MWKDVWENRFYNKKNISGINYTKKIKINQTKKNKN